jgi:hypothetical protein
MLRVGEHDLGTSGARGFGDVGVVRSNDTAPGDAER